MGAVSVLQKTKDGVLRDDTLSCMDHPANDTWNSRHLLPPKKTRALILEKKTTFEKLKGGLPPIKTRSCESDQAQKDAKADEEAVGTKVFKYKKIRDLVDV